jgi:hypothetical protein
VRELAGRRHLEGPLDHGRRESPFHWARGHRGRRHPGLHRALVAERQEDRIEQASERLIRFNARTDDDIDGFHFKLTPSVDVIRFALQIDERARPEEIEVGRDNFKPGDDPLVVRLR